MTPDPLIQNAADRIERFLRAGQFEAAQAEAQALVEQAPAEHESWEWLGAVTLVRGRFAEAEAALSKAVSLDANQAHVWNNLASALRNLSRFAEAEACARRAIAIDPSPAAAWAGLGNCLFDQARWEDAVQAYQQSLARDPRDAQAWTNLGVVLQSLDKLDDAQAAYEQALKLAPEDVNLWTRYALLHIQRGDVSRGVELAQSIVAQAPQALGAWVVLGNGQRFLDNLTAAEDAYRRALQLAPTNPDARLSLALVLLQRLCYREAEAVIRPLTIVQPLNAQAWTVLGGSLHAQGRIDEALAAMRRSVEVAPNAANHSKLLVVLPYSPDTDAAYLLAEHREWDRRYAQPLPPLAPGRSRPAAADHRLRIGFVATDFIAGPTGFLGLRAMECLDKSQCSVVCYSDRYREEDLTARFRAASELFRVSNNLTDDQLAEQVIRDEVDMLVDLGGHVGRRLLAFARRAAPLQLTWLGYVGTTGMTAMDGLIADHIHVRAGEEAFYTEAVLRMPHDYICYGPPGRAPEVGPLPAAARGYVTFGCFNNPAKYSPPMLDAWAEILRRVPTSKLLLKYGALDQLDVQAEWRSQFARRGIDPNRISMEGWSDNLELLDRYNRVDLALDTHPYSGGLTTCEALWMGVPVVTFPGKTFASRHSTSHLTNAGCSQFVAADSAGYIELAVRWANRLEELAAIRARMREQVRTSPLCDGPRFARDFLALVREAWAAKVQ